MPQFEQCSILMPGYDHSHDGASPCLLYKCDGDHLCRLPDGTYLRWHDVSTSDDDDDQEYESYEVLDEDALFLIEESRYNYPAAF